LGPAAERGAYMYEQRLLTGTEGVSPAYMNYLNRMINDNPLADKFYYSSSWRGILQVMEPRLVP
jgi:hypothetical protein